MFLCLNQTSFLVNISNFRPITSFSCLSQDNFCPTCNFHFAVLQLFLMENKVLKPFISPFYVSNQKKDVVFEKSIDFFKTKVYNIKYKNVFLGTCLSGNRRI